MSSQSGTAVASPQVFVNKAARKIVIERKIGGGQAAASKNCRAENSKEIDVPKINDELTFSKTSADEELEEGEIDSDAPRISTNTTTTRKLVSKNSDHEKPELESSTPVAGENLVQRKMTALERLKSLNFSAPKSSVNPFTLAAPKPSTSSSAVFKDDKAHVRRDPPSRRSQSPPRKRREAFNDLHKNRKPFYDRNSRNERKFNYVERAFNFGNHFSNRRDFYGSSQRYSLAPMPEPLGTWSPPREFSELTRHEFDDVIASEPRRSPLPRVPTFQAPVPADDGREYSAPVSNICWEKVRELTVSVDDLNILSVIDLRAVVQHLLDEETQLIQLHLRLQDQMKNVRRTLDREKQIEQLKKQALAATLAAKNKEDEASRRKHGKKDPSHWLGGEDTHQQYSKAALDKSGQADQHDFDDPFAQALKQSINEQAAARKAHLVQYVTSAGVRLDYATGQHQSTQDQLLSKEKCAAVWKSFFDGIASIT